MVNELHIEQIRPDLTFALRREVLYPGESLYAMKMDEDATGIHFGAFCKGKLVAVVSVFQYGTNFQFRKFAVAGSMQFKGVGTGLLNYITNYCQTQGATKLWCNARLTAIPFYNKAGFVVVGAPFIKSNIEFVIMEKAL